MLRRKYRRESSPLKALKTQMRWSNYTFCFRAKNAGKEFWKSKNIKALCPDCNARQ